MRLGLFGARDGGRRKQMTAIITVVLANQKRRSGKATRRRLTLSAVLAHRGKRTLLVI